MAWLHEFEATVVSLLSQWMKQKSEKSMPAWAIFCPACSVLWPADMLCCSQLGAACAPLTFKGMHATEASNALTH